MSDLAGDVTLIGANLYREKNGKFVSLWTEAEDSILRTEWPTGLSATKIGMKLGRTKNSVIGRVQRLGLEPRQSGWPRAEGGPKRKRPSRSSLERIQSLRPLMLAKASEIAPAEPLEILQDGPVDGITLMELDDGKCRWPINDPPRGGQHLFCGDEAASPSSYCECHSKRAWVRHSGWALPLNGRVGWGK